MEPHNVSLAIAMSLAIILMGALLSLAIMEKKAQQVRYEQCIAADMQWSNGSCLK